MWYGMFSSSETLNSIFPHSTNSVTPLTASFSMESGEADAFVKQVDSSGNPECNKLLQTLPSSKDYSGNPTYQYQGYWYPHRAIEGTIAFQNNFKARDSDIILASSPKCGTTWLKALVSAIACRKISSSGELECSPLLTVGAHEAIPFLELQLYLYGQIPDVDILSNPRLFATHVPYATLPESVKGCACKIIYICRNPLDVFISDWHFAQKFCTKDTEVLPVEESFEMFCQGMSNYGPFWDHTLGFWRASLDKPDKVLFLKYENMKKDTSGQVKRLAEFIGFPFSTAEEDGGIAEAITSLCSFDNLKNLDVHKNGRQTFNGLPNTIFFRKGVVGDWVNYLKPDMVERFMKIMREKLSNSGLSFEVPRHDQV